MKKRFTQNQVKKLLEAGYSYKQVILAEQSWPYDADPDQGRIGFEGPGGGFIQRLKDDGIGAALSRSFPADMSRVLGQAYDQTLIQPAISGISNALNKFGNWVTGGSKDVKTESRRYRFNENSTKRLLESGFNYEDISLVEQDITDNGGEVEGTMDTPKSDMLKKAFTAIGLMPLLGPGAAALQFGPQIGKGLGKLAGTVGNFIKDKFNTLTSEGMSNRHAALVIEDFMKKKIGSKFLNENKRKLSRVKFTIKEMKALDKAFLNHLKEIYQKPKRFLREQEEKDWSDSMFGKSWMGGGGSGIGGKGTTKYNDPEYKDAEASGFFNALGNSIMNLGNRAWNAFSADNTPSGGREFRKYATNRPGILKTYFGENYKVNERGVSKLLENGYTYKDIAQFENYLRNPHTLTEQGGNPLDGFKQMFNTLTDKEAWKDVGRGFKQFGNAWKDMGKDFIDFLIPGPSVFDKPGPKGDPANDLNVPNEPANIKEVRKQLKLYNEWYKKKTNEQNVRTKGATKTTRPKDPHPGGHGSSHGFGGYGKMGYGKMKEQDYLKDIAKKGQQVGQMSEQNQQYFATTGLPDSYYTGPADPETGLYTEPVDNQWRDIGMDPGIFNPKTGGWDISDTQQGKDWVAQNQRMAWGPSDYLEKWSGIGDLGDFDANVAWNKPEEVKTNESKALSKNEALTPHDNYTALRDWSSKMKESLMREKDYDGDGKIESGQDEWKGSRDKAIKRNMREADVFYTDDKDRVRKFDDGR